MALQSSYRTTVIVDGVDLGAFDTFSGGQVQRANTKHRPGGSRTERLYKGLPRYEAVTVGRTYELERDHDQMVAWLQQIGPQSAEVRRQPLDSDGNDFGPAITSPGAISQVTPGNIDSNSDDRTSLELQIDVEAVA